MKEERILRHYSDLTSKRLLGDGARIAAIQKERPGIRLIEPEKQGKYRALARATRTDQRKISPWRHMQIQVNDRWWQLWAIAECDVIEPNISTGGRDRDGSGPVLDGGFLVKDLKNAGSRNEALLEDQMNPA
jgi:hypothetical protein